MNSKNMNKMKAWKEPITGSWGIDYRAGLTEEFGKLIETVREKIEPFSDKEISRWTYYFKVKGEEVSSEFDCCDNEKCIKATKSAIREYYGKGTHVGKNYYDNDGDHENIETCYNCGKPLNEWLTWCDSELEYLEGKKPWTSEFIKDEAFIIHCIFQSMPTMDDDISGYAEYKGGDILKQALYKREQFFQRIKELANSIIANDFD